MAEPNYFDVLKASDLFHGVDDTAIAWLAEQFQPVHIAQDDVVFELGDSGDAVYVIVSGDIALEVQGVTLAVRSHHEFFGEFALIDDRPRSADAIARTSAHLLRWERANFQRCIREHPDVASGVFRLLTSKLRENIQQEVSLRLERERWRQDLERAREIQAGMLPAQDLLQEGLAVCGRCRPAEAVGGDFFDFFPGPDGSLGIVICDVTGHGFYAGLFVAMVKSALRNQAQRCREPKQMMDAARQALDLSLYKLLMSCCYVLIEPAQRRIRYANAGHPPPLLRRAVDATLERLEPIDPILGVFGADESPVTEMQVCWAPEDRLMLYTDGITEFKSSQGEFLGVDFLIQHLLRSHHALPRETCDTILAEIDALSEDEKQRDDVTLVLVCDSQPSSQSCSD